MEGLKAKTLQIRMSKELALIKQQIARLQKGNNLLAKRLADGDLIGFAEAARLFVRISKDVEHLLARSMWIHDYLLTGKTVVINHDGQAIKLEDVYGELNGVEIIDPFHLDSLKELTAMFGEELISDVRLH